jgi:hypothetical protein
MRAHRERRWTVQVDHVEVKNLRDIGRRSGKRSRESAAQLLDGQGERKAA